MIAIGCDHAGYGMKKTIVDKCLSMGFEVKDFGCDGERANYAEIAYEACKSVVSGECDRGILICGTGIGIGMAANKTRGIRAALCTDTYMARMTRLHNDANVLTLGARVIGEGVAEDIVEVFLTQTFEGGRHTERLVTMARIEAERE